MIFQWIFIIEYLKLLSIWSSGISLCKYILSIHLNFFKTFTQLKQSFLIYKGSILLDFREQTLCSRFMLFLFAFLYILLTKRQSHGLRHYFVLPTIIIFRDKIEKKKNVSVSQFVIYSELSRIKRLAWVKLSRKSNTGSNEKRAIH